MDDFQNLTDDMLPFAEHLGIEITSIFKAKVSSENGKLVAPVTQSQLAIDKQVIHCKLFKEIRCRDSRAVADSET